MLICYLALFALLVLPGVGLAQHLPPQPFERFGYRVDFLTLSKGKYQEFFPNDSLRKVGSVVYNRRLRKIARLLPLDTLRYHAPDITGQWLSLDPFAEKYPEVSPYAFCNNNPVNLFDPDGREWKSANDRETADRYVLWAQGVQATLQAQMNRMEGRMDKARAAGKDAKADRLLSQIMGVQARVDNLSTVQAEVAAIGADKNHVVSLEQVNRPDGYTFYGSSEREVNVQYNGNLAHLGHELMHVYQIVRGDTWRYGAEHSMTRVPGGQLTNEVEAYIRQFSLAPGSMPASDISPQQMGYTPTSMPGITRDYVGGIYVTEAQGKRYIYRGMIGK